MSATSFSSGSTCLQVLEPLLELRDLRLELRQPARRRHAPGDVRAQRRQPRLTQLDVRLHLRHVEVPEAVDRAGAHDDERADLGLPGKFAERQFHECLLGVSVTSSFGPSLPARPRPPRPRPAGGRPAAAPRDR